MCDPTSALAVQLRLNKSTKSKPLKKIPELNKKNL